MTTTRNTKSYGPQGTVVTGRCRKTGRTWAAVVGPSGKLIRKTYS